ncbi:TetR/AcrR family transcriptional regulator [Desertimonas flava]|uniref:TetR/AcrR family transcriptional regulator n=1 Tax=Desertimonas flava TaxID=2064846 RepID=UPI0013C4EBCC|nr:TetR/AcrR family transcriptional regulator [Desertimonas flava]
MTPPAVRRGRPPGSAGVDTRSRLLDAAADCCVERGFDGATLSEIARRAHVTTTAVYNHFDSREDLLYAAGVRALRAMTDAVRPAGGTPTESGFAPFVRAYLRPDMARTRRLLAELHLAGNRDQRLADLLNAWHDAGAAEVLKVAHGDEAAVKALFLLLLGLCHLDDLPTLRVDPDALERRILAMTDALGADQRG